MWALANPKEELENPSKKQINMKKYLLCLPATFFTYFIMALCVTAYMTAISFIFLTQGYTNRHRHRHKFMNGA